MGQACHVLSSPTLYHAPNTPLSTPTLTPSWIRILIPLKRVGLCLIGDSNEHSRGYPQTNCSRAEN